MQTLHLLTAFLAFPFVRHMYDWVGALEGGEGRDCVVVCNFRLIRHGCECVFMSKTMVVL